MIAVARTHRGMVRTNNQDSWLVKPGDYPLFVVADGMGGHRGGNVASRMAVDSISAIDTSQPPREDQLLEAFHLANANIFIKQSQDISLSGMGTTLTAIWEDLDSLLLCHVGDSRAYRFTAGSLNQVTMDHSLVGELLRSGAITAEMAINYPYRNIITKAVGTDAYLDCDVFRMPKQPGDRWLICSDGLTEYAKPDDIKEMLRLPLESAADGLLSFALEGGGRDNITLIVLEVP